MAKNHNRQGAGGSPPPARARGALGWFARALRAQKFKAIKVIFGAVAAAAVWALTFSTQVSDFLRKQFPTPDIQEIAKQLDSSSGEQRLAALSQLKDYESRKLIDMENALAVLQESISRRASRDLKSGDAVAASTRETTMALQALSHLLKLADEREMKLQRPRLTGLNLTRLDLGGLYLRSTDWQDVDAQGARLVAADLKGARLDGVQLALADASQVDLSEATLKRVCFESAVLDGAKLARARIDMSDLNAASLQQADLTAAVLWESRMNGANMAGALLSGADLSTALEWLPRQEKQVGARDAATAFPAGFRQLKLGVCG